MSGIPHTGFRRLGEETRVELWKHTLVTGTFESPDGERFERTYLRMPDAVAVVPVDGDEVVLVRQYRGPLDTLVLEIPAGLCDDDDASPTETANRELAEEVGLHAARLEPLTSFHNMCGTSDHLTTILLGRDLSARPTDRQGPEERHMTVERVKLADTVALIDAGTITDAKTIIGLLLARERMAS